MAITTPINYLVVPEVRTPKIKLSSRVVFLLETLEENPFPASRDHLHTLDMALSSLFKASSEHLQISLTSTSIITFSSLTQPPYSNDSHDYTGSTKTIQDNQPISQSLTITSAKSPFLSKVTYSQVLKIRTWTSLGRHSFSTTGA